MLPTLPISEGNERPSCSSTSHLQAILHSARSKNGSDDNSCSSGKALRHSSENIMLAKAPAPHNRHIRSAP